MSYFPRTCLRAVTSIFQYPLALTGGVLLCLSPIAALGQSVTFAGAQSVIPASFQPSNPPNVAVDSAGDVLIADYYNGNGRIVELPRTAGGYGPQITLPFTGFVSSYGVAIDAAGDVFISNLAFDDVLELPKTPTGYGPQMTLPFNGLKLPFGIAIDSTGDLFVADFENDRVVELPKTPTGYGPQVTLPTKKLAFVQHVAVDNEGDVLITNNNQTLKFPKTATGYGPQITLPTVSADELLGLAVDNAGDVFIDGSVDDVLRVVKFPKTATGYAPHITLPLNAVNPDALAVDGTGNIFVVDNNHQSVVELQTVSVNFGGANVCAHGETKPTPCSQTLTLTYDVNADTTLGKPEVLTGGLTHLDFTRADGSTCTGAVTAGATCTVNVTFSPLAAGFRHGSVDITDGSGTFIATTRVSGFGIVRTTGAPVAQLSTSYLPFGAISFGAAKTQALMVANVGGGTLTVAPSISGHSYKISESTCAAGVAPGTSCTLVVEFSPTSIAKHDDTLTVETNGGSPTVQMDGSAIGLSVLGGVSGGTLDFGTVSSGSTKVELLTVTNIGLPGAVTVGTGIAGRSYSVLTTAQNTCQAGIAAGQSCTLPVQFSPTKSGLHNDLLSLVPYPGGGTTTAWLAGITP